MQKMNDPHVAALLYSIEHDSTVDYRKAPALDEEVDSFRVRVEDKKVRLELREHYATEDAALEAAEPYIRSWEMEAALLGLRGQFKLRYRGSDVVDRNPPPTSIGANFVASGSRTSLSISASLATGTAQNPYPPPPNRLTLDPYDPDVLTMLHRFEGYLDNREHLVGMAYFCFSMMTDYLCENEKAAATKYGISRQIFGKMGNLTGNKGGRGTARKAVGINIDLTSHESRFLEEAVKAIILRLAQVAHDPDKRHPQITLSDLPPLSI